jgi:LacI family transcriptional regulator
MKKRVTIKDVASEAGVSYQTVSRVINNNASVLPETRKRIKQIIKDLDYSPDPMARGLAGGNSHTLGVIIATFTGYICSLILEGSEEYARKKGYNIVISGRETHSSEEPYNSLMLYLYLLS